LNFELKFIIQHSSLLFHAPRAAEREQDEVLERHGGAREKIVRAAARAERFDLRAIRLPLLLKAPEHVGVEKQPTLAPALDVGEGEIAARGGVEPIRYQGRLRSAP